MLWQHLDRDVAPETCVVGAIDRTHAIGAEGAEDLMGAEVRTSTQRHRLSLPPVAAGQPDCRVNERREYSIASSGDQRDARILYSFYASSQNAPEPD